MLKMKTADVAAGVVCIVLGVLMVWGGYVMDRLEVRQIHPASIPGLVPMIIGALLAISGVVLVVGSLRGTDDETITIDNPKNLLVMGGLCLIFALGLVSRMPFYLATFLFVATTTYYFARETAKGREARLKLAGFVLIFSALFAWGVSALFQYAFLVRLP